MNVLMLFLVVKMSKDKPTPLPAMKMRNCYTILMRQPAIVFTHGHLFLYNIYCVTISH